MIHNLANFVQKQGRSFEETVSSKTLQFVSLVYCLMLGERAESRKC